MGFREPTPAPAHAPPASSLAGECAVIKDIETRSIALEVKYYGLDEGDLHEDEEGLEEDSLTLAHWRLEGIEN